MESIFEFITLEHRIEHDLEHELENKHLSGYSIVPISRNFLFVLQMLSH